MNALIADKQAELAALCRRARVERLYLFGSAAQGRFRSASSDLDFLVEMSDRRPDAAYADRFLAFADALEQLFGRPVDLITEESVRNPYLRREVEATRKLVYGEPRKETVV